MVGEVVRLDRTSLQEARAALVLAPLEPRKGRELAASALSRAQLEHDVEAASVAERALGLASRVLNEVDAAVHHLRNAVRLADRTGDSALASECRSSLAFALALAGRAAAALREVDRASEGADGPVAAALATQRALILQRLGRADEALAWYRRGLPVLRRSGDQLREARALSNRAILFTTTGATAQAERDLQRSLELYQALGHKREAGSALHNLAFVAGRRGDVPAALERYDAAEAAWQDMGLPAGLTMVPRCELLLSVRLPAEARACIDSCIRELAAGGASADLAEARLMLAQAALAQGDFDAAREAAILAAQAFVRQRRAPWATLARYTTLQIDWRSGTRTKATARLARRVATQLEADGWAIAALDARLIAARISLDAGETSVARTELVKASAARFRGPVQLRARAWHAEALLRMASGNCAGALRAIDAGLASIERHRAALGATELRARAGGHGEELAGLGLELALKSGRAPQVLRWAERWRAGTLRLRPVRPPDQADHDAALAELRQVADEIDQAALARRDTTRLLRRQGRLEADIVRRSRRAGTLATTVTSVRFDLGALHDQLGERAFVELVDCHGQLHAVTVAGGRCRLHALTAAAEVAAEVDSLRFSLRRLAWGSRSAAGTRAAICAVRYAADRLEAMLLAPLRKVIADRELVVVPTGTLHALPWSVLPSCIGRPVSVAPSAALWQRAGAGVASAVPRWVVLVAGPDLPGGAEEVDTLATMYPAAATLRGADATATNVMGAIAGADLLHLAAHGTFRADNPLFSSLRLAEGPLNVYDLEGLAQPPKQIVLAACESGVSMVHPGDELLGLVSACLSLGTQSLVACVMPVPDEAARTVMLGLHRRLTQGRPMAQALADAAAHDPDDDGQSLAAKAAFVCFGAG